MKKTLLITLSLFVNLGGAILNAQTDVTSQYITNPGFEDCEALPTVKYHDNQKDIDIDKIEVWSHWNTPKGTDYSAQGWKLVEQMKNANGGVVTYGCNIQVGQYASAGEPGPATGATGTKGLCFTGSAGLVYQQTDEITLPAGVYRLTVNLYARNGQTTNPGPTQEVVNIKTGFLPTGGTEENLIPAKRNRAFFTSNAWAKDVLDVELTEPTTGRFQISYGSSYFVIVDDIKLENFGDIVTTNLAKTIARAKALNVELSNNDLSTAISNAEAVIANPTDQDAVTAQISTLYSAMATALSAATGVVNITSAYLENPSFEAERMKPWEWGASSGTIAEAGEMYEPYIDGKKMVDCATGGTILQTISHLPAGFYAVDAKLNGSSWLILGKSTDDKTICTGGKDPVFLRYHPNIYQLTEPADIIVGVNGSGKYHADDFRLFYGKDAASLEARLLTDVKTDAQAILNNESFNAVTGSERTDIQTALEGNDYKTINTKINTFITSLDKYNALTKKKGEAVNYTQAIYPYASASLFADIQTIVNTAATSATNATELTTQLDGLYFQVYVSNAYCEGVDCTDYTANIKEANIAAASQSWAMQNTSVLQLGSSKAWKNPKTSENDNIVFGTSSSYNYSTAEKKALILKQTLQGLPAGKYVLSMTMMASTNLNVNVFFNNNPTPIGTMVGKGTASGGKYGAAWNDYTFEFTKTGDDAQPLQIQCTPPNNYTKEFYIDNFRLYLLNTATGIQNVQRTATDSQAIFDLQGRRIAQPGKGLYIVNGKKVIIK